SLFCFTCPISAPRILMGLCCCKRRYCSGTFVNSQYTGNPGSSLIQYTTTGTPRPSPTIYSKFAVCRGVKVLSPGSFTHCSYNSIHIVQAEKYFLNFDIQILSCFEVVTYFH
ncbi:unnamed protein product, partial [Laminaria digitata]